MSFAAIFGIAERIFLVVSMGLVLWWIHSSGEDHVKLADFKAQQKQLTQMAVDAQADRDQRAAAELTHEQELSDIEDAINQRRSAPVYILRRPPDSDGVPPAPTTAESAHPQSGGADSGVGADAVDIRAAVNAFELKYEHALADCREVIASWPH